MKGIKLLLSSLLLAGGSVHAQEAFNKVDPGISGFSSWDRLPVGDKLLANGQLLNPAGQSLDLPKGVRVLNLAFVQQKSLLVAKTDRRLSIIDAADLKEINHVEYPDKKETGSMNGLITDSNDSTVYFTGLEKFL